MCGIVGYIGKEEAAPILLEGLKKLEYRGYDSAGLAIYNNGKLDVIKSKGRLDTLYKLTDGGKKMEGTAGIGHTRWATHGEPSDKNSHPHVSQSGKIAVVHNGIIENYQKMKELLVNHGVKFSSDTDTEVVAQLLEYYYEGDLLEAVSKTLSRLEGSYALGIMSVDYPDRIIAARKENPLILAVGDNCNYLASDVAAVVKYTRDVIYLDDDEIAVITNDRINIYNTDMDELNKPVVHIDWNISDPEKGSYEHFMFKEIMEQPKVISDTISPRLKGNEVILNELDNVRSKIDKASQIYILGCGSAYHVGVIGKYLFEKYARIPSQAVLASEFRYSSPLVDENTLVIVISQSGETADTIAAMREAKRLGSTVIAIVNVVGSTIAKEADSVIYTWAGIEVAVATTKAYSAQLAVIHLLCLELAKNRKKMTEREISEVVSELKLLPSKIQRIIDCREKLQYYASLYFNNDSVFFIGRNLDYAICLEGSLKLKEISYIHSEAYAAGELKHGTISLIEPGTLVVALATYEKLFDKLVSNITEVRARGADVLGFASEKMRESFEGNADSAFYIPNTHEMLTPSLAVIPLQLFSYYVALMRGCDIDKPRNLAKSVTVE